jgi:hypothetical protein
MQEEAQLSSTPAGLAPRKYSKNDGGAERMVVREVQARIMQWLAKVQEEEYRQGQTCDPTVHMQSV